MTENRKPKVRRRGEAVAEALLVEEGKRIK
jgi:hypothetical protein